MQTNAFSAGFMKQLCVQSLDLKIPITAHVHLDDDVVDQRSLLVDQLEILVDPTTIETSEKEMMIHNTCSPIQTEMDLPIFEHKILLFRTDLPDLRPGYVSYQPSGVTPLVISGFQAGGHVYFCQQKIMMDGQVVASFSL